MPEPKRLGEFSPEFVKSELGLIDQVRTERKGELSDYIATERPQLKQPEGSPSELDLVRQVMAERKKAAPVAKERGALGELVAGFGRGVLGVVAAPAEIADVAGEAIGWEALEKAGEAGVKAVEKYIEESPKLKRTESISKNILKNPELWKDPRWYSSIVGEGLPTILSMVVPGMAAAKAAKVAKLGAKGVRAARIAGGLSAGVGLEAAGAASDIRHHEEQTGEEIPISTKLQSVLGTGIVAGSLEYVPIFAIFGKAGAKKLVGRVLSGMAMEGTTEGAQGLIANAFAKAGYDADRNMVDGVVESIVGGVLLGGGMGAVSRVTNFKERVDETNPDEVSDILEQVERETEVTPERPVKLTEAEKRQAEIDREFAARRTPEERQAEIEAAMPATPMTTISEETTKLAEEGIKPAPAEEVIEPDVAPPVEEVVEEPMPAAMRAMGMRPPKPAVPFMITKETESRLKDLGYTKDDVYKMAPEDALSIVEDKIAKEPIIEKVEKVVKPKPRHEMTLDEFVEETRRFEIEDGMSPEEAKKTITRETEMDSHKRRMLYAIEQGKKLPRETLREYSDDPRFAKALAEIEPKKAKPIPKKVYTGDIKFTGMQHIKGEPSVPLFVTPEGGQVEYDSAKHKIMNLAEYEKAIKVEEVKKPIEEKPKEPVIEKEIVEKEPWEMGIKEFEKLLDVEHGTISKKAAKAIEIEGIELRPPRIPEGEVRPSVDMPKSAFFLPKGSTQTKIVYSEILKGKVSPSAKILVEDSAEFKRLVKGLKAPGTSDMGKVLFRAKDAGFDIVKFKRQDTGWVAITKDAVDFRSHKQIIKQAISEGKPVPKEVLAEYPDLVPAKPITPKPAEPTPPVAVREEIEAEPIPEVAPKVEKEPKVMAEKDLPLEPDFSKMPLSDITVKIKAVRKSTGEIVQVEETAKIALEEIDQEIETYYTLLDCL